MNVRKTIFPNGKQATVYTKRGRRWSFQWSPTGAKRIGIWRDNVGWVFAFKWVGLVTNGKELKRHA